MKLIRALFIVLLVACALLGCDGKAMQTKRPIVIAYTNWDTSVASANIVKLLLNDAGYDAQLIQMPISKAWEAVANSRADAMLSAWLPDTQKEYLMKYRMQIEDLGPNLEHTRTGLVVPDYVKMLNIYELRTFCNDVDHKIFGIERDTGIIKQTMRAISIYKLDLEIVDSTEKHIIELLNKAQRKQQWIIFTGWQPHWMFSEYKLRFLDDPDHAFGNEQAIHTIVSKKLHKEAPLAWQVLKNFYWNTEEIESLMLMNHQLGAPDEDAKLWLQRHPKLHKRWLWHVKYSWFKSLLFG